MGTSRTLAIPHPDHLAKLEAAGFVDPSIQLTRTYARQDLEDLADTLAPGSLPEGTSTADVIYSLEGAFASAFIRADKV